MFSVGVLTLSDKGAAGQRDDRSGPLLAQWIAPLPAQVVIQEMIADDPVALRERLVDYCDRRGLDLVLTTGGTGVAPRDITPDVTRDVSDRLIPGLGEMMRMEGYRHNPRAVLSRAVAGIRGRTLIVNLPGSPRAVQENIALLLPLLSHTLEKIRGDEADCGAPPI